MHRLLNSKHYHYRNCHHRFLINGIVNILQNRFYHPIKGIFGNYCPYQLNLDQWSRRDNSIIDGLPSSYRLIKEAFQKRGHLLSQLDPLQLSNFFQQYHLKNDEHKFYQKIGHILGVNIKKFLDEDPSSSLVDKKDFIQRQFDIYCGNIGYEFSHLISLVEHDWFEERIEREHDQNTSLFVDQVQWKEMMAKHLLITEALDHFLAKKFQSVKRYGCEGAETMMVFIQEIIQQLQEQHDIDEIIIGMPHRGRLNLLINTLNYPMEALFNKLSGRAEFEFDNHKQSIIGDVLSHLYTTTEYVSRMENDNKKTLRATLLPNPSHLEVVAPVVCGYARGQMIHKRKGPYFNQSLSKTNYAMEKQSNYSVLPIQIHGDASFTGQGIIMETLAMASVEHYTSGGSIHLVVNNQIGYTTPGCMHQGRSSLYCTDPMKMISAPVIHVNGDHPELVSRAARVALDYQQTFHKDVAIDLVCFRRWGHNEMDDPTFTNPKMYQKIHQRKSIPKQFAEKIRMSEQKISNILSEYNQCLNEALSKTDEYQVPQLPTIISSSNSAWKDIRWPDKSQITKWDTSVPESLLKHIGKISITPPENWNLHQTLKKVFKDRESKFYSGKGLDWATTESLAFGSLLYQGIDVRISGQDVGRGTFSQRHCMIVDQSSNDVYIPLNNLMNHHQDYLPWKHENWGLLEVCNSILSEEAVIAFEYGLSLTSPQTLVIWEAQFGDFFNVAQPIIDTLVSSGEGKWLLQSSLTLLLPNGYDGAGPEHTSARLERFLQLSNSSETDIDSDNVNWSVAYPTTPAQYFHLLRRQINRPYRKPLVVMTPKMLLRHSQCVSTMEDLSHDRAHFLPVLDDAKYYPASHSYQVDPIDSSTRVDSVRSIIFCSGKHFYALKKERDEQCDQNKSSIAIVRLEELCPFPALELTKILKRYPNAKNLIWSQEEHRNMGAWNFVETRFRNVLHQNNLQYVGRGHLEAPAVGIAQLHQKEVTKILKDTFEMCSK